jgi:addiction module HigA family antidote
MLGKVEIVFAQSVMASTPIHPGEFLDNELKEIGISAAQLARTLHVPTNRITQIINGQRGITADTALRLARYFGTSAKVWVRLQTRFELEVARAKLGRRTSKEVKTFRVV